MRIYKLVIYIVGMMFLTSCDPALRLEVINLSDKDIHFTKQELNPEFVYGGYVDDSIEQVVIVEPNSSRTEFYGIGGWWDGSDTLMQTYLDSILETKYRSGFESTIEVTEFGESLLIYKIRDR